MKRFRYKNILLYTSHQWCGNTEEYFVKHTEKLGVFLLMPRIQTKDNILRIYEKGKLVKTIQTPLTANFFLYYLLWYCHYIIAIFKYFPRNELLVVITAHPYVLFATTFQKLFRKIEFVYYIADYYPPINLTMQLYERLKRFYHKGAKYRIYLGDGVNKIMNGKIVDSNTSKTIMLGVKSKHIKRDIDKAGNTILFVGVIRPNVGLEIVYEFLRKNPRYSFKILGICDEDLYREHQKIIRNYNIFQRVYFPNNFFFDQHMNEISKDCFVGVALYTIDNSSTIYYADPGKVKTYSEMDLPVIMSNTSSIAPYVERFQSGEVIERNLTAFSHAVEKIKKNYDSYVKGVERLNEEFNYEKYYGNKFSFLEKAFEDK